MTVFSSIAALLTLLALAWLLRPLLWPNKRAGVSSQRLNASIYSDQLEALDRDLARGAITAADCEATRDELKLRMLDDTEDPAVTTAAGGNSFWTARRTAAVIALLVPIGAVSMYTMIGNPAAIDPVATHKLDDEKMVQMVEALAARLKANPDNPKGWAMLARSYKAMGRMNEAEQAYVKAGELVNTDADLMVDYADLLAVKANNDIEGKPLALVNKALALNPQHPMGLMMSGVAAYRRNEFKLAVAQWEKLLTLLDPESADAQQVDADIQDARAKAGMPSTTKTPGAAQGADAGKLPPVDAATAGPMTPEQINGMVERLAARLKAEPGDLAGWVKLARAYKVQGKLAEAEAAYGKAGKMVDADPDLLTQYADLLATRAGGNLDGRALALVSKALVLAPKHPMALMMAGSAAFRRADYPQAVAHWEKVLTVLDPASQDYKLVTAEIADARAKGGMGLQLQAKP
jgi:cytochrome c-type biogenesis protein CcmH